MAIAVVLPLVFFSVTSAISMINKLRSAEQERASSMVTEISRQTVYLMRMVTRNLHPITSNPVLRDYGSGDEVLLKEMKRMVDDFALYKDISIYTPDGFLAASTSPFLPEFQESTRWFQRASKGELMISTPQFDIGLATPNLWVYIPMRDDEGTISHVIKARIPFSAISDLIKGAEYGARGRMILLDSSGNEISGQGGESRIKRFDERISSPEHFQDGGSYTAPDGKEFTVFSQTIDATSTQVGEPWTLVLLRPSSEIQAMVNEALMYQAKGGLLIVGVSVLLGLTLAKKLAKPMSAAANAAQAFGAGEFTARMPTSNIKEISVLARAFDKMATEVLEVRYDLERRVAERTANLEASQQRLRETTAQLTAAYEAAQEGILVIGRDGEIVAANNQFESFFKVDLSELSDSDMESLLTHLDSGALQAEGLRNQFQEVVDSKEQVIEAEWTLSKPEPRLLRVYSAIIRTDEGAPVGRLFMWYDITEERELQRELQEAHKMEAVGRLAGGVAHDFNNLLAAISGSVSLAQNAMKEGQTDDVADLLHNAATAATGGRDLVRQLLGYSRRNKLSIETWSLGQLTEEVRSLLSRTISPLIDINVNIEPDLWPVKADRSRIHQVLMNLCINAADALKGRPEARMSITLANAPQSRRIRRHDEPSADYVCLKITDNGEGIPDDVKSRIFEPFFTTKAQGEGTGLGLATCLGIVQQHGGWIECNSAVNVGTTFSVFIPRGEEMELKKEEPKADMPAGGIMGKKGERILVVDDDALVRTVAERTLTAAGYKVFSACDGVEALEYFERDLDAADLVLLDLTMPRMSGPETMQRLYKMNPDIPVVICSGFLLDMPVFASEHGLEPADHIQKPYELNDLKSIIRRVLNESEASGAKSASRKRASSARLVTA